MVLSTCLKLRFTCKESRVLNPVTCTYHFVRTFDRVCALKHQAHRRGDRAEPSPRSSKGTLTSRTTLAALISLWAAGRESCGSRAHRESRTASRSRCAVAQRIRLHRWDRISSRRRIWRYWKSSLHKRLRSEPVMLGGAKGGPQEGRRWRKRLLHGIRRYVVPRDRIRND